MRAVAVKNPPIGVHPGSLTFHWFLPTNGDSRHVVGGGHGTPVTAAGGDRPPTVG